MKNLITALELNESPLSLVFPNHCIHCEKRLVHLKAPLCHSCFSQLSFLRKEDSFSQISTLFKNEPVAELIVNTLKSREKHRVIDTIVSLYLVKIAGIGFEPDLIISSDVLWYEVVRKIAQLLKIPYQFPITFQTVWQWKNFPDLFFQKKVLWICNEKDRICLWEGIEHFEKSEPKELNVLLFST